MNRKRMLEIAACFIAVFALMMAGSDGDYFPIPNFIGIAILGIMASLAAYKEELSASRKLRTMNSPDV